MMRRPVVAILLALVSACAGAPSRTTDATTRESLGRTAVVAVERAPGVELAGIPSGKGGSAASAAARAGLECVRVFTSGGCSGMACNALLLVMAVACPTAAVVGGIVGAAGAESSGTVDAGRARLQQAAASTAVQGALREQVAHWARAGLGVGYVELADPQARLAAPGADYRALARLGVDSVLEASVEHIGTASDGGFDPQLEVVMAARVRIVRTADNSVAFEEKLAFRGARRTLAGWMAEGARPLEAELGRASAELSRHIVEHALLLYPFPGRGQGGGLLSPSHGLAPLGLLTRGRLSPAGPFSGYQWPQADSVTPRLRWEAFPRAGDLEASPAGMARVANVGYDLVIAEEQNLAPARIVYRRERLGAPEHRVEEPLAAKARYFWSVRARFELDGRAYVTEWAQIAPYGAHDAAPNTLSYRFVTP